MAFNIRRMGRTYLWVCLVAVALLAFPVIKFIFFLTVSLIAVPFSIIINITKGNYGEAFFQFLLAAGVGFLLYKYFDRILHAAGWVYVVVGDLVKGSQAAPGGAPVQVINGESTMSDNSLKRRGQDDPLDRITGNPLDAAAQTIKARLATKTAEEMTKALRAKTDLYTAHSNYGQATLAHDDTAVELEQKNRTQRRENKQADLDVHAGEQKLKKMAMEEKLREAEDRKNKTPLQQDEAEFEKKRSYRLFDARDDAFESFEFEAAKDIELTKQYVKKRKEIENDPELEDEDVKKALLNKLEEQYKAQLQRAGKKQGA